MSLDEDDPSIRKKLFLIIASAIFLRIISIFLVHPSLSSDSLIYHRLACSLVDSGSYALGSEVTAYRPPGYPFVLAAVYALAGSDILPVRILQSVIDVLTCVIVFRLGKKLFSVREGLAAAAILSVYVPQLLYSQAVLGETLFTFFFLLLLYLLTTGGEKWGGQVWAGAALGLCVLIKPMMAAFPAAMFAWGLRSGYSLNKQLKSLFVVSLVMGLVVSPWLVRNRSVLGEWVFTTNGGINFWIGNNPQATGAYKVPERSGLFKIEDEITRDKSARDEAIGFIKDHPVEALKIVPWKFFFLCSSESAIILNFFERSHGDKTKGFAARYLSVPPIALLIVNLPYYMLFLLCLPSLILEKSDRGKNGRSLLISTLFFWIAVHLLFFGSSRFHTPVMAFMTIFAARSLFSLRMLLSEASKPRMIILILSFFAIIILWMGEWAGMILSL
jgi:4-amino-4-deoxy-L-arabinose transferase-like glycosyltransferase